MFLPSCALQGCGGWDDGKEGYAPSNYVPKYNWWEGQMDKYPTQLDYQISKEKVHLPCYRMLNITPALAASEDQKRPGEVGTDSQLVEWQREGCDNIHGT